MYRVSLMKKSGDIMVKKTFLRKKQNICIEEKDKISIYSSKNPNENIATYISTLKNYEN